MDSSGNTNFKLHFTYENGNKIRWQKRVHLWGILVLTRTALDRPM